MNENEIMNEEITTVEETNVVVPDEVQESTDGGIVTKLVIGAVGAATAAAALYKNRHKIIEWRDNRHIKALEKKGYTIYKTDTEDEVIDVTEEFEETEE